jgi:hypothetical protein
MSIQAAIGSDAAIQSSSSHTSDTIVEQRKRHRQIVSQIRTKDPENTNNLKTNHDTVARKATVSATKFTKKQFLTPIFKWNTDTPDLHIIPEEKTDQTITTFKQTSSSSHILALFGYKIDLSNQVEQFKQKFQTFYIESKSHNALVGKFSELKFGITMAILGFLGVDGNTLETLKKEALKKAISDNIECFEQNEYNIELLTVFSNKKKDISRIKILTKLREQLITQMNHYGNDGFYSTDTINYIKKQKVQTILMDLLQEHQNLTYILGYQ